MSRPGLLLMLKSGEATWEGAFVLDRPGGRPESTVVFIEQLQ